MTLQPYRHAILLFVVLLLTVPSQAITTAPVEVTCPICGTKNTFYDYMSWGSSVYQYPSKFQFVFWPHTDSTALYICSHCHLSLFMWDFKKFPTAKKPEIEEVLKSIRLESTASDYRKIPMAEKLAIAEKVYEKLGQDDQFWAGFYRVMGYHLAREKRPTEAKAARAKALEITQKLLADAKNEEMKKELLLTSAAMRHFLNDDSGALNDLQAASALRFAPKGDDPKKAEGYDGYLAELIKEYIEKIKAGTVPEDMKPGER
jgi:hypothetical protein